ncbi:MAG: fluoride efflux transporter CrcB [Gammaproteobacteria bacterium]|nr:fluoride efflux transporter CrcB [Pseudomonadales bacterium]MCP5346195.1 fluoride efflux transporter CrcB [Pseudomonadales bacterium]
MSYYLAIALGGALGAVCRYWLVTLAEHHNSSLFPVGTLTVNVLGSLLIGILFVLLTEKIQAAAYLRPLLQIGFLGALTTFSTFSLDTLLLMQQGMVLPALSYITLSVILCILAAWAGMGLMRFIL